MSTVDRLAQCLSDPGKYLEDDNFQGTVFEACSVINVNPAWKRMSLKERVQLIRSRATLPDREWQEAHEHSCDSIIDLLDRFDGKLPMLRHDPQIAVEASVHIAVMLLSDDNVTAEVCIVVP